MITVGSLDPASPDAPVAAHFGDPLREQRLTGALVDRTHRGVLRLTGPERLTFLHNITTQYLLDFPDLTATQSLILSPHGHIEHHFWVTSIGDELWLDTEPGYVQGLEEFLLKMRFFTQVEISLGGLNVYSLLGSTLDLPEPWIGDVPPAKFATGAVPNRATSTYPVKALPGGGFARRTALGTDLLLPPDADPLAVTAALLAGRSSSGAASLTAGKPDLSAAAGESGVQRAGIWAYEALRVAAGVPRLGFETDHKTLPSEAGLTAVAVHLEKGCYRGQETVARVHHLGRPPRSLRLLHLDGVMSDNLPAQGTPITSGDRTVGFIGTAVRHFEEGPIALGVLKQRISGDTPLVAGESTVAVESSND
ncbi:CAF17-like 4Fe-4S cluster assembly/insertion protein YgfZ [Catelliglobosispora koreensis]|uniref:CAF17-like 4Fe-4S cluster assembly/insertion protein YgfZ n=1 Tax=Catelliglobosispora koreensis TaxID=129052 RepID=UPI00039FAB46|nr:folate-binding protein YgfZ [Catelliglobosispora koreensis]